MSRFLAAAVFGLMLTTALPALAKDAPRKDAAQRGRTRGQVHQVDRERGAVVFWGPSQQLLWTRADLAEIRSPGGKRLKLTDLRASMPIEVDGIVRSFGGNFRYELGAKTVSAR